MFLLYLKIACRSLLRRKTLSLINILGPAIALTAFLLIRLYVHNERRYDAYHPKTDRIVRMNLTCKTPEPDMDFAVTPAPLAALLLKEFSDIGGTSRVQPLDVEGGQAGALAPDLLRFNQRSLRSE